MRLLMETWELAAREGVRDTIARYAHLVDAGRIDEVADLFTPDGVLEANDLPPAAGRDAIRAFLGGTKSRLAASTTRPWIRHHVSSVLVEVEDPTTATARAYFFALTERGPDHWGRYRDRLVLHERRWRFAHRRVRTDGAAAGGWVGTR
jgi:ketosteroid isomerase-like protein